MEIGRGTGDCVGHDNEAPAVQQRAPDLPDREIESIGMEQGPAVVVIETEIVGAAVEQAYDVAVLDHDSLGLSGGTGGIDHVCRMRARDRGVLEIHRRTQGNAFRVPGRIQVQYLGSGRRQPGLEILVRDDPGDA